MERIHTGQRSDSTEGFMSDPKALRRKAVEIRSVMETVRNPVTRRDLLSLAERFDRLADQLELWIAEPDRLRAERGIRYGTP
jgi:hypothetical protein